MAKRDEWAPVVWHCLGCGDAVTGYRNNNGEMKAQCSRCHTVMVRKMKGRHHNTVEIYTAVKKQCLQGVI